MNLVKMFLDKFRGAPPSLTPAGVKTYYEDWTDRYIKTFGNTFQSFRTTDMADLFNYMIANSGMKHGQRVLDAGCGVCGPATYFASKLNIQLDAVTISPLQCSLAEQNVKKFEKDLKGKISVKQGDYHKLEKLFPKETFDMIYFLEALTHSTDVDAALRSCKKVLKTGGVVYIKDLYHGRSEDKETQRLIDVAVANVDREFALKVQKIEVFKDILAQSGFEVELCRQMQIMPDYSLGNQFVAANGIVIFENQVGAYDGIGLTYLDYYETRLRKVS